MSLFMDITLVVWILSVFTYLVTAVVGSVTASRVSLLVMMGTTAPLIAATLAAILLLDPFVQGQVEPWLLTEAQ